MDTKVFSFLQMDNHANIPAFFFDYKLDTILFNNDLPLPSIPLNSESEVFQKIEDFTRRIYGLDVSKTENVAYIIRSGDSQFFKWFWLTTKKTFPNCISVAEIP